MNVFGRSLTRCEPVRLGLCRIDELDDESIRDLPQSLMKNPQVGEVIKGTESLRKIRHAEPGVAGRDTAAETAL